MIALPGISIRQNVSVSDKITLWENPVGGFIGLTERGPLHEAVLISGFQEYQAVFGGLDTPGYLPLCVYSFFQNGGRSCRVIRIAHLDRVGGAEAARLWLPDKAGEPALFISALSPGTWGNDIRVDLWFTGERNHLSIQYAGRSEDFLDMSLDPEDDDYYVRVINSRSGCVKIEGEGIPVEANGLYLNGGQDGLAALTPGDFIGRDGGPGKKTGLTLLENYPEVNLIAIPDTAFFFDRAGAKLAKALEETRTVHRALACQAEQIEGRFALLDMSGRLTPGEAVEYVRTVDSSRAALYYPWVTILDPLGGGINGIPPSCSVAGLISGMDLSGGCFCPPGNLLIHGAVGQTRAVDSREAALLYERGVNVFRVVPGDGIRVWGVKTLSSDPKRQFINVVRTVSLLASAIRRGTAWAVFEPNDAALRKRLIRHVTAFLIDVWRRGYLAGKTPDEAFFVQCDSELNPGENINTGLICARVGLCVVKPAEYITVTLEARREHTRVIVEDV